MKTIFQVLLKWTTQAVFFVFKKKSYLFLNKCKRCRFLSRTYYLYSPLSSIDVFCSLVIRDFFVVACLCVKFPWRDKPSQCKGLRALRDWQSQASVTAVVTHAWRHHARNFSSHATDPWVHPWGFDMSNLHERSWTSIVHLLLQDVKCACTSRGVQQSARVVCGVCSHDCSWDAETYDRWVV